MKLTTQVQDGPEAGIAGIPLKALGGFVLADPIQYVVVSDDGIPVAQMAFFKRVNQWWVDALFIAKSHRLLENKRVHLLLKITVAREVAKHCDHYNAWIERVVASPEKVLRGIGVPGLVITMQSENRLAVKYQYDVTHCTN